MDTKPVAIVGCLVLLGGMLFLMLIGAAFMGIGGSFGEGDTPSSQTAASTGGSGRWTVAKLPLSWKQFYSDQEFEDLKVAIQKAVDSYSLPAHEFLGVLQRESGGNPNACGPALRRKNGTTYNARGIGQFIPETAAGFGIDACNPLQAVDASGKLLDRGRTKDNGGTPNPWGTLRGAYFTTYNPGARGTEEYIWDGGVTKNGNPITGIKDYADQFVADGNAVFVPAAQASGSGRYWSTLIDEAIALASVKNSQGRTVGTPVSQIYGNFARTSKTCAGSLSRVMARTQEKLGVFKPDEIIVRNDACIELFRALTSGKWAGRVIAGSYTNGTPTGERFGTLVANNQIPRGALVFTIAGNPNVSGDGDHVFMFLGVEGNSVLRANGGGSHWILDRKSLGAYANMPAIVVAPDTGIWNR